jgi:predicted nucleic acid-binding protein
MSLVCFDTNFVIWGFKRQSEPAQKENISKAQHLLRDLEISKTQIMIPTMVLAEVLSNASAGDHHEFIQTITTRCIIGPFDTRAAIHYSRMWRSRLPAVPYTREVAKIDYMIAAVALAMGCRTIYTDDPGFRMFAQPHIPIISMSDISVPPEQLDLFNE